MHEPVPHAAQKAPPLPQTVALVPIAQKVDDSPFSLGQHPAQLSARHPPPTTAPHPSGSLAHSGYAAGQVKHGSPL